MKLIEETPNAYFVSIHQNMFGVSSYWGSQVFYSGNNPESEILAKCPAKHQRAFAAKQQTGD